MSRHYPNSPEPKFTPLRRLASAPATGDEARKQMLEDSARTRGDVFAGMDIPDDKRAELESVMAMFSQKLIGELSDDEALETFQ